MAVVYAEEGKKAKEVKLFGKIGQGGLLILECVNRTPKWGWRGTHAHGYVRKIFYPPTSSMVV